MVSIVIPLYNKSEKIERCLHSVLKQSYTQFEIVLVNDGSTDDSLTRVSTIKDNRLIIHTTENHGVVHARNLGIKLSSFKIVAFLDADDFWLPNHLETLTNLIHDFPDAGLYTTKYSFYAGENQPNKFPVFVGVSNEKWRGYVTNFYMASQKFRLGWTGSIAVPKHVLTSLGGFDETMKKSPYGEDIKLWTKIAMHFPVAYDTTHTAVYDLSGENHLTKSNFNQRTYATFDEFVENEKKDSDLKKYLDMFRTEFAIKQKMAGDIKAFKITKQSISNENLNWKEKLLFLLPTFFLRKLYSFKSFLNRQKITLEIHN